MHIFSFFGVILSLFGDLKYNLDPESGVPYRFVELLWTSLILIIGFGVIVWYFPKLFEGQKEEALEKMKKEALTKKHEKKKRKSKSKSRYETFLLDQQQHGAESLQLPKKESKLKQKVKFFVKEIFINKQMDSYQLK